MPLSRRAFARTLSAGAAFAVLPPLVTARPGFAAKTAAASDLIRLSANENPYGPSAASFEAMKAAFSRTWRYPDESQDALIEAIARSHSVSPDQILLGNGSSEILKLAAASFIGPSRSLVMAEPTFEAIGTYARAAGAEVVRIPLDPAYGHDLAKMGSVAGAGLVYVCNPNNPTGSITPKESLSSFLRNVPAPTAIVVDEAYHHYATGGDYESAVPSIASRPNLIVARTFSKIYGMAGLRCGYAVSSRETIRSLAAQQPWDSINVMAIAAARASITDTEHVAAGRKRNAATRSEVVGSLLKLGYAVIPSEANFIMIDVRRDVRPLIRSMRERRVHVGRLFPAMPHHMRVTIGRPEQMEAFLRAFAQVVA